MVIKTHGSTQVITLTPDELAGLIDREAKERLNISGEEFLRRYRCGTLDDSWAVRDIEMLVHLGKTPKRRPIPARLRGVSERNPKQDRHVK